MDRTRLVAVRDDTPMPPYAYVPRGPWPHPTSDPAGHSAGQQHVPARAIEDDHWADAPEYLRGVALFNAGYYWEAHESWESLWHAHGRRGPTADLLRALIKLAAAGLKVREGRLAGVVTHAQRARALVESIRAAGTERLLGLDLVQIAEIARLVAEEPPNDRAEPGARVSRVFEFTLEPR
jgi:hypothetical protein